MIGHRARLLIREVMGQSYSINACTRANDALYSSVHVTFFGSWMQSLLKGKGKGNLIGTKCRAHGTISYKIFGKSHHLKRCGRKRSYSHCFAVTIFMPEYRFCARFQLYRSFRPINFLYFFLIERRYYVLCTLLLLRNKNIRHHARLKENEHSFCYRV